MAKIKRNKLICIDFKHLETKEVSFNLLTWFQPVNWKYYDPENMEGLKKSIVRNGFTTVIDVWFNDGVYKILSGHHRYKALKELIKEKDYTVEKIRVNLIDCENEQEAHKIVLSNNTVVGVANNTSTAAYMEEAHFVVDQIQHLVEEINIPNMDISVAGSMVIENLEPNKDVSNSEKAAIDYAEYEKETKDPSNYYIILSFEDEKQRSKALKDIDPKLSYSTATDLDINFK